MMKRWDTATTTRFVQEYAKHTCLWDVNNENYKSRSARDAALEDIVKNMGMSDFHPNDVKCKIRIIRNTYINEIKKIRDKKKLIDGKAVNYVCNIPWFKTADQFLRKVVKKKKFPANLVSLDAEDDSELAFDTEDYADNRESPHNMLTLQFQDAGSPFNASRSIKEESQEDSGTDAEGLYSYEQDEPSSAAHSLPFSNLTEARSPASYFSNRSPVTSSNLLDDSGNTIRAGTDKRMYKDEVETTFNYNDEFDMFAKNVGLQLKKLPLENALQMQAKIHQLLIDERLKVIRRNKRNDCEIEHENNDH